MDRIAMLFLTFVGVVCICAGYKLFCGLPALNSQTARLSRSGVFMINVIPGVLLALFGTGLLMAQVHGALTHKPAVEHRHPASEGATWHRGKAGFFARAA